MLTNMDAIETLAHIATLNAANFRLCTTAFLPPNDFQLDNLLIRINGC